MAGLAAYTPNTRRDLFKINLAICLKIQVYTDYNGQKYAQHHMQGQKDRHLGQGEDTTHRHNQQCETNEVVLGRAHQQPQRRSMDLAGHHLETIDKQRRQVRPVKQWIDDLDKYWQCRA